MRKPYRPVKRVGLISSMRMSLSYLVKHGQYTELEAMETRALWQRRWRKKRSA